MGNTECPRCRNLNLWSIRRGKLRCRNCRYEWKPNTLSLHLNREEWKELLKRFLLKQSGKQISHETSFHRQRVLRAFGYIRKAMQTYTPEILFGDVVMDMIDLNSITECKDITSDVGILRGNYLKEYNVLLGLFDLNGFSCVKIISNLKYEIFMSFITERVRPKSYIYFNPHKFPNNISMKNYIFTPVVNRLGKYIGKDAKYMNVVNEFWISLNHNLISKRGIRKEKRPVHITEYVWRNNHREISINYQINQLLNLLEKLNLYH